MSTDRDPSNAPASSLIDLHAHLDDRVTVKAAVEIARERGVKLGIVEHGGRGQTIGHDEALVRYAESLDGYPVYKGLQAEGLDWNACFSSEAIARLDYILADALTFPEQHGSLVRLWRPHVEVHDVQSFMDRYVDFNVQVLESTPINILANPTFLPGCIADRYAELWTQQRTHKVVKAAVEHQVAIEINARYSIPSQTFIQAAKDAGVRFSFGSNQHGEDIGRLDYCVRMIEVCKLTPKDVFLPGSRMTRPH